MQTAARHRVMARNLLPGDKVGSGETVVGVSAGVRTPRGKVEVTLTLHGCRRTVNWNAATYIGIERGSLPLPIDTPPRVQSRVVIAGEPVMIEGASRLTTVPARARAFADHLEAELLRSTMPQLPADVGLFGDDSRQLDLVDAVRAAERKP